MDFRIISKENAFNRCCNLCRQIIDVDLERHRAADKPLRDSANERQELEIT